MSRFSESSSESNYFIFFNEYEEEHFEKFIEIVLRTLNAVEVKREQGPYSTLVTTEYEGCKLSLTSGSFEGCFISLDKKEAWLAKKIIGNFWLSQLAQKLLAAGQATLWAALGSGLKNRSPLQCNCRSLRWLHHSSRKWEEGFSRAGLAGGKSIAPTN